MKTALAIGLAATALTTAAAQTPAAPNPNQRFMSALTTLNPLNTSSIVYAGTGSVAITTDPKKPAVLAPVKKYTVSINYGMGMTRLDVERATPPKRITKFLANDMAWDVVDGRKPAARPGAAAERLRTMFMTPHGAMRAAFDPAGKRAVASEAGPDGRPVTVARFQAAGVALKAYFDDAAMITKVQTPSGDIEFLYSDYKNVEGIPFPTRILQKIAAQTVLDLTVTDITPNAGLYLEVPEAVEKALAKK